MALIFRWYLGSSSRWAIEGDTTRRTDYQIWSGPAMGAFNRWTAGSFLAEPRERTVTQIALNLLEGAAVVTRAHQARTYGVPVPAAGLHFRPTPAGLRQPDVTGVAARGGGLMASDWIPQQVPIAVVGVGAFMPGSTDLGGFWRNVLTGRDLMTDVPASRWLIDDYYDPDPRASDKTYGKRGAFLPEVDFDPVRYGIPPNNLSAIDTSQLLALMVAEQVLADCAVGLPPDRDRVSVRARRGAAADAGRGGGRLQRPVWLKALREHGLAEAQAQAICDSIAAEYVPWQEETFPGLLSNVVSGRIANQFDLHGTNHTTDAACASSLAALSPPSPTCRCSRSDMVITGGVDTINDISMYMCFTKTPALSPTGDCRPFSDAADGTMLGEGVVMFALKRLADAERDGDRVYAVIRGMGTSSDGRGTAIYAPLPAGQVRALRRAYEAAGYGPETVELVEAHGTGTKAGDAAEFTALREVFGASRPQDRQWCALGSVKSQIGHTKAAAGAAGLLKAVLALQHKVLPPTIKVDRPNPALGLDEQPLLPQHGGAAVDAARGRGRPSAPRVGVELRVRRHQLPRHARGVRARHRASPATPAVAPARGARPSWCCSAPRHPARCSTGPGSSTSAGRWPTWPGRAQADFRPR